MKAIVNTSKVLLATTFLSVVFAGCERAAQDQASGTGGTSGTATAPANTAGTSGTTAGSGADTGAAGTSGATTGTTDSATGTSGGAGGTSDSTPGSAAGTSGSGAAGTSGAGTSGAAAGDTSGAGSSAGTVIDDSIITTRVKTALLADDKVKGTDINVETEQGEVMLSGFVESKPQMDEAVKIAQSVEGVKEVTNKMTVKQ